MRAPTGSPQERIVHAALDLIAQRGMAGVTMSAIAEAAGVARQTLYNHFPDVDSIVMAVIDQHESSGLDQLRRLLAGVEGAAAKLEQLIRHSLTVGAHGHVVAALQAGLPSEAQDALREHRGTKALIAGLLQEGMEEGVFRPDLDSQHDADFVLDILMSVGGGLRAESDVAQVAGAAVRFVMAAVASSR